jgi:hypothetical protein
MLIRLDMTSLYVCLGYSLISLSFLTIFLFNCLCRPAPLKSAFASGGPTPVPGRSITDVLTQSQKAAEQCGCQRHAVANHLECVLQQVIGYEWIHRFTHGCCSRISPRNCGASFVEAITNRGRETFGRPVVARSGDRPQHVVGHNLSVSSGDRVSYANAYGLPLNEAVCSICESKKAPSTRVRVELDNPGGRLKPGMLSAGRRRAASRSTAPFRRRRADRPQLRGDRPSPQQPEVPSPLRARL